MGLAELALLMWMRTTDAPLLASLRIPSGGSELERELLQRCAVGALRPQDTAQAALLFCMLRATVLQTIESVYERNWQVGKDRRDAAELATTICGRFHIVARQLLSRREDRPTVTIRDEYDVQDLMHALLRLHFSDVRPEEWTPSYAGGSSRMDFLLMPEKIVIETKMTRPNLDDKKVANELIIDKERYRSHKECKTLICFVYDPEGRCRNPVALEADLSSKEGDELQVVVIVGPKGA